MTPYVPKYLRFHISESKRHTGICVARRCGNKQGCKTGGLCAKHYYRHRKIVDPIGSRFVQWRADSKRRCKDFSVTREEFLGFCQRTGYLMKKGYCGKAATIDRVKNQYGYHIWNLQIKPLISNIRKYHDVDKHITELPESHEDFVPF